MTLSSNDDLQVVAGIIQNSESAYLCTLRSNQMSHSGVWEFPGGKVHENETHTEALERELLEELSIHVHDISFFHSTRTWSAHHNKYISLHFYKAQYNSKTIPVCHEHAAFVWLTSEYLHSLNWAEADEAVIKILRNSNPV